MLSQPIFEVQQVILERVATFSHISLASHSLPERTLETLLAAKEKTAWVCLQDVEASVDDFLAAYLGFDHHAIPHNYLDEPPASLAAVEENLGILMHCLSDLYLPQSSVRVRLMDPLRRRLYSEHLTPLRAELERAIHSGQFGDSERGRLLADASHLRKMAELEDTFLEAKQARPGPSDVVPICGLVASRLHRLENEARTVIGHWRR